MTKIDWEEEFSRRNVLVWCTWGLVLAMVIGTVMMSCARAETIDMNVIIQIESSNNPVAYNTSTDARGLGQITPICLKEYNQFNKASHQPRDLFNPLINKQIMSWYLTKRIPQMLRYYNKKVTVKNCIIAYNAGIKAVVKGYLPKETRRYINRYNAIMEKRLRG